MIEFNKNVKKVLPYDRRQYIEFFDDDFVSSIQWYGVSFQLNTEERELGLVNFFKFYEPLFKKVLLYFNNSSYWIVNHDYYSDYWFPNDENTLNSLRTLFKQNKIPFEFRGALIFSKNDLLEFSKDLLSYPFAMFNEDRRMYSSLDISHGEFPFIMKISDHWCIDLLSTDKILLRKVVEENSSSCFKVKEYRGTSLLR
jgi:hypothetical protein